jgi:hypothetical protein
MGELRQQVVDLAAEFGDSSAQGLDARLPHPLMRQSFLPGNGLPSLPRTHPLASKPAAQQVLLLVVSDGQCLHGLNRCSLRPCIASPRLLRPLVRART